MQEAYFIYDGTFEGLLTGIFDSYAQKRLPIKIVQRQFATEHLFGEELRVITNHEKADRVAKKLREISLPFFNHLALAFNSEEEGVEMLLFNLVRLTIKEHGQNRGDFRHPDQLRLKEIVKKVQREIHRMHAFVRFQRLADNIWFSTIEPDFDVLPFISSHFKTRYADQQWVIYDLARGYGLHYDLHTVSPIKMEDEKLLRNLPSEHLHPEEQDYQQLWKDYFSSVNIAARRNTKLHLKHLPKRYWKYLSEK